MKVVYVPSGNDKSWGETLLPITAITGATRYLTPGKIYDVIEEFPSWNGRDVNGNCIKVDDFKYISDNHSYNIIDDLGYSRWYASNVLIPLEKYREDKLNELGI